MNDLLTVAVDTSIKLLVAGAACWILTRRAGLASAARAHGLWGMTLAAFLAVPLLDLLVAPVAVVVPDQAVRGVLGNRLDGMAAVLLGLYGAGVVLCLIRLAAGLAGIRRLLAGSIVLSGDGAGGREDDLARECAACGAVLAESAGIGAPATAGFWRPRVLLPEGWRDLDPAAVRLAVRHELAHVARFDYPVLVAASVVRAVFWFHPVAWIACARLRWHAELACDEAVSAPVGQEAYAAALLAVAGRRPARPPQLTLGAGSRVGRRVGLILGEMSGSRLPPLTVCAALAVVALWLGASVRVSTGASPGTDGGAFHAARHALRHGALHR